MRITTESGAVYEIIGGICCKTGHRGEVYSPFMVWTMKAIDQDNPPATWEELRTIPDGDPEIGKRMYVSGKDEWWISTKVVSIEEIDE